MSAPAASGASAIGSLRASQTPIAIRDVELSRPLPRLEAGEADDGRRYRQALVVVRLHGFPLGLLACSLDEGVSPQQLAARTWDAFAREIRQHLAEDGLPQPNRLDVGGVSSDGKPRCLEERRAFLQSAPGVTVVIPTRDRPVALVDKAVSSVLACDYPRNRFDIVVVDNAPTTDATRRWAQDREIPYVREPRPGISNARNRGIAKATGEVVAFTDDDAEVEPQWLAEITRPFTDERVGCVTGLVVPLQLDTPPQVWFEQYRGVGTGYTRRVYDIADSPSDEPLFPYTAGRFGAGNNCAFRRSMLDAVGRFDPALGAGTPTTGGEDIELFFRVVAAGYRLVFEPAALARHLNRSSLAAFRRQMYTYGLGLGSYLTKVLTDRRHAPGLIRRVPRGLALLLARGSEKNRRRGDDFPADVSRLELLGLAMAPAAYVHSRRLVARRARAACS